MIYTLTNSQRLPVSIGKRVAALMKAKGWSEGELGRRSKVNQPTVHRIIAGTSKDPRSATLEKIAEALGTTESYLRKGDSSEDSNVTALGKGTSVKDYSPLLGGFETWDSSTPLGPDEVEVPFFTDVNLSAGAGAAQVLEFKGPKLRFARSTLKRQGVQPEHAACARVDGNSMEPVLPHGSTVGIDTNQTQVQDGKMFAIDHDGLLRIKVLYRLPRGGLRLRSFNQDEWPDEQIQPEDMTHVRILGKVFWYSVLI